MILGDYEFRAKGSRYALDQQMKLMNTARALEALASSGVPVGELHIKFWLRMYESLGFEDKEEVEKILRQEIAQFKQQQAALMQAKAGGTGAGGGDVIRDMTGQGMNMDMVRSGMGEQIPGGM